MHACGYLSSFSFTGVQVHLYILHTLVYIIMHVGIDLQVHLYILHTLVYIHMYHYVCMCSVHLLPTFLLTFYIRTLARTLVSLTYDMIALQAHKLW